MVNIVLCGGSGTRLWPVSRQMMPKQFIKLFDNKSLFQLTCQRNCKLTTCKIIVSNQDHYFLALDQVNELDYNTKTDYLLEGIGRNTAPAIALACFSLGAEELVIVTPSDHIIKDQKEYENVIHSAKELAKKDYLVTFGITPDSPQTGFGYIESDGNNVKRFHEKPTEETARKYLLAGNYYWNSGMFCFKAGVYLSELEKYSPRIFHSAKKVFLEIHQKMHQPLRISKENMLKIPNDSIDYAVMEKSDRVKIVASDIGWSDLGSFDALYDHLPKDSDGNTSNNSHISFESKDNLIFGNERKIATVAVDNLIIVDTKDALLVSKKGASQKVKNIVDLLQPDSKLPQTHLTVHRPWGTYTILEEAKEYKIKKLEVKVGQKLSLQKHLHRNEHWVVVSGTATVTIESKVATLRENESTYIKMGEYHRLENQGKIPLIIVETQVGSYLGEDDIIRAEDDFKRNVDV